MKPNIPLLAGLALIAAGGLHAQDLNLKPAPPPPGIHDKGATPVANPPPEKNRPAIDLPAMHDNGTDANGNPPPQVTVRTEGEDTVEEYREGGRITMIRITPSTGRRARSWPMRTASSSVIPSSVRWRRCTTRCTSGARRPRRLTSKNRSRGLGSGSWGSE